MIRGTVDHHHSKNHFESCGKLAGVRPSHRSSSSSESVAQCYGCVVLHRQALVVKVRFGGSFRAVQRGGKFKFNARAREDLRRLLEVYSVGDHGEGVHKSVNVGSYSANCVIVLPKWTNGPQCWRAKRTCWWPFRLWSYRRRLWCKRRWPKWVQIRTNIVQMPGGGAVA